MFYRDTDSTTHLDAQVFELDRFLSTVPLRCEGMGYSFTDSYFMAGVLFYGSTYLAAHATDAFIDAIREIREIPSSMRADMMRSMPLTLPEEVTAEADSMSRAFHAIADEFIFPLTESDLVYKNGFLYVGYDYLHRARTFFTFPVDDDMIAVAVEDGLKNGTL